MPIRRLGAIALIAAFVIALASTATASAAALTPPTNVRASTITSTSITLSWTRTASATSYDVYLGGYHSNTSSASFNFTQLTACTSYTLGVRSRKGHNTSTWVTVSATTSGCSAPPASPSNTSLPTISGSAQQGQTLSASPGSWTGSPTGYAYQWQHCASSSSCTNITGATGQTYALQASDVGDTIDVVVTATNAGGSGKATSAKTSTVTAAPAPPPSSSGTGLHVSGSNVVNGSGSVVRLHGVDYSGTEYACVQGYGVFDGSVPTQAYVNSILAAHVNAVRIPLNEDCWLGINGISAAYSGGNYQAAIKNWVALLESNGITPILELHWNAPGTQKASGQQAMPDADHSGAFWQSVATMFGADNRVIFDLYNEPYTGSWACWRDGGSACTDVGFAAVGMQSLINTIRQTGASNVLMLGCLGYSNDCADSNGSWTQYRPSDPNNNLAASVHIYIGNGCQTSSCWSSTWLPIIQGGNPIIVGEWGSYDYNGANYNETFGKSLLDWLDANHASGYLAWTWNNWGSWSTGSAAPLISSDDGSTLTTWGQFMSTQYAQRFP